MTTPYDSEGAQQRAIHWAVRSAHCEMSAQDKADLQDWLAQDPRHQGAYLRARAGLKIVERGILAEEKGCIPDNDNDAATNNARPRSPLTRLGGFALASLAVAASVAGLVMVMTPAPPSNPPPAHAQAETRKLDDGSLVTLHPGARIDVAMSGDTRNITLLAGEAVFHVAKDRARPFVVRSGAVYAQATGTIYSVRRMGALGGAVHVTEGGVLVWARDEREQAVLLHAGDRLTLAPQSHRIAPSDDRPALPLPQPAVAKISLDNVPLALAVERFNKVNSRQIIIADPEIGKVGIVGLFNANNPERFARSAAIIADADLVYENNNIVIKMKK